MKRLCVLSGKQAFWEKQIATDKVLRQGLKDFSQGHYVSSDLKRLKNKTFRGHPIYRLKLNNKARVSLSFLPPDNQPTLLGYIPKHRYERDPILNRRDVASQKRVSLKGLDFDDEEAVDPDEIAALLAGTSEFDGEFGCVVPNANAWITLDGVQEESLNLKKPGLIEGVPGSGKTLLGLAALAAELENLLEQEELGEAEPDDKICYVVRSATLRNQVKEEWQQFDYSKELNQRVEFVTVAELLAKQFPDRTLVGKEHFSKWYQRYQKVKAKDPDWIKPPYDAKHIEKELSVCAVYPPEIYETLGMDLSHVAKAYREQIYQIYEDYAGHLKKNNCLNEYLCASLNGKKPAYNFTFVDEYQDLNYSQLRLITEITRTGNILYSGDREQNIKSSYCARSYLYNLHKAKLSVLELVKSYRLPVKIAMAANIAKKLKKILRGGTAKGATTDIKEVDEKNAMGQAYFIPLKEIEGCAFLKREKGADFAVVTTAEYLDEARKLFGTDVVHTVDTIKGLQYRTVVAYKCLDESFFKEAKRALDSKGGSIEVRINQPKVKQAESPFDTPCDSLYTILSRSTQNLIVCDEKTDNNALFLEPYLQLCDPGLPPEDLLANGLNSDLDWQNQAYKLWSEGESTQSMATMIYQKKLRWTERRWQQFLQEQQHIPGACEQVGGDSGQRVTIETKQDEPEEMKQATPTCPVQKVVNNRGRKKKVVQVAGPKNNVAAEKQHKEKLKEAFFREDPAPAVVSSQQKTLSPKEIVSFARSLDKKFTISAITLVLQRCNNVKDIEAIFFQSHKRADNSEFVLLNTETNHVNNTMFIHAIMRSTQLLLGLNLSILPNLNEYSTCSIVSLKCYQKLFNDLIEEIPEGELPADPTMIALKNNGHQMIGSAIRMGLFTDEKERSLLFAKAIHWDHPEILSELFIGFGFSSEQLLSLLVEEPGDNKSLPLLHFAAKKGALDSLDYLINQIGMDPTQQFQDETLVHHAIRARSHRVLRWALENYPNLWDIANPLQFAVKHGDIECLKTMLTYATPPIIGREGDRAYSLALQEGKEEMCEFLKDTLCKHRVVVKARAPSLKKAEGKSGEDMIPAEAIAQAVQLDNVAMFQFLLNNHSIDIDAIEIRDGNSKAPLLFYALSQGAVKILEVLLQRRINLTREFEANTLVHYALRRRPQLLLWVVKAEASLLGVTTLDYGSPVYLAAKLGLEQSLHLILHYLDQTLHQEYLKEAEDRLEQEGIEGTVGLELIRKALEQYDKPDEESADEMKCAVSNGPGFFQKKTDEPFTRVMRSLTPV